MRLFKCLIALGTLICGGAQAEEPLSPFVRNVVTHVVLHELAHGLIREFDLPVLGNEEDMADTFATLAVMQLYQDRAEEIIKDRARSWFLEQSAVAPKDYDLTGEHLLDGQRAYRMVCIFQAGDPAEREAVAEWAGLPRYDADDCANSWTDFERGWPRVLAPHRLPEGEASPLVEVIYGEGPMKAAMQASGLLEELAEVIRAYDWPLLITLHFDHCDSGAFWSRTDRTIMLCDDYVARFVAQEAGVIPK